MIDNKMIAPEGAPTRIAPEGAPTLIPANLL
jgi:hypothetical protein